MHYFMMLLYLYLLKPLVITVIVEELCVVLFKEKSYKIYLLCLITNIITNI